MILNETTKETADVTEVDKSPDFKTKEDNLKNDGRAIKHHIHIDTTFLKSFF